MVTIPNVVDIEVEANGTVILSDRTCHEAWVAIPHEALPVLIAELNKIRDEHARCSNPAMMEHLGEPTFTMLQLGLVPNAAHPDAEKRIVPPRYEVPPRI